MATSHSKRKRHLKLATNGANGANGANGPRSAPKGGPMDFVHTGPGTLAGRYMRSFWQPVLPAQDLKPGRAMPIRVMSEDFTLYRGQGGAPHLVAPRCPHRGTLLSTGWVEDDCVRCFYHGWKFDSGGQCVDQPAEDASFAAKVRIKSYPTQEYLGVIFAYLGEGPPPPLPRYPELETEGPRLSFMAQRPCNYFQNIENSVDEVHIAFVHRIGMLNDTGLNWDLPEISAEETPYGLVQYGKRKNGIVRVSHFLMPNTLLIKAGASAEEPDDLLLFRVPIDDETHHNVGILHSTATGDAANAFWAERARQRATLADVPSRQEVVEQVLAGKLHIDDLADRPDLLLVQDDVSQCGQGRIADRTEEQLGRSDVAIILLRKLWARELRALAEGRPRKAWQRPEALVATLGV